ncbi:hypothetical protein FSARC_10532 [Fusarium sarcochroum]|uniref:Major facilitator superfamily (MFS) profile domain-containing protein n=1 Tax=Fusarium sarcochroum TaxID=1208366 RepID=A0A8H4X422_9HYPO|nr:hypothetical protein FSARC_10532 [Fusarium sarcochroum]
MSEKKGPSFKERYTNLQKRWTDWQRRQINAREGYRNVLSDISPNEIREALPKLAEHLPTVDVAELDRAFRLAKAITYYAVPESNTSDASLPLRLGPDEIKSLKEENESVFSQRGMLSIITTVSLAAFLQGHVQASINAGDVYATPSGDNTLNPLGLPDETIWSSGAMNAMPYFTAALLGAPLSLPINICMGPSSLGSAFAETWLQLLCVRIIAGVAMGIKAVSAPVLASETAVRFWRGSIVLAWQLWVACGILIGSVVNMIIAATTGYLDEENADKSRLALRLILGAPAVPAFFLIIAVSMCYESPRYYMRYDTPGFSIDRAFQILLKIRSHRIQALRDLILIWWPSRPQGTENKEEKATNAAKGKKKKEHDGLTYMGRVLASLGLSWEQYSTLFGARSLRNAVCSTCIVSLAQQLCGVNVFAFYSNKIFSGASNNLRTTLAYSVGFGAVNFLFGLLAMRSIDWLGRRRWLLSTLPLMSLFLMAAAVAYSDKAPQSPEARNIVGTVLVYCFVAAYAPGLGPIPFTLASESFPSSHREAGASVAITTNLFFAGLLSILLPKMHIAFHTRGTLGVFSVLNVIAFVLVFFLIEETSSRNLEDLASVYARPKSLFIKYLWTEQLPYFVKKWFLWQRNVAKPPFYHNYGVEDRGDLSESE